MGKVLYKLLCDFEPGVDRYVFCRIVGEFLAKAWICCEALYKRRVVAVFGEKGIASIFEEEIWPTVKSEDWLMPAKIFLQLGVAILVCGYDEGIGLAHYIELFLFRKVTEEYAVFGGVGLEVAVVVPSEVELYVFRQLLH